MGGMCGSYNLGDVCTREHERRSAVSSRVTVIRAWRPALQVFISTLDILSPVIEQEGHEDAGHRAAHVGEIGDATGFTELAERPCASQT